MLALRQTCSYLVCISCMMCLAATRMPRVAEQSMFELSELTSYCSTVVWVVVMPCLYLHHSDSCTHVKSLPAYFQILYGTETSVLVMMHTLQT